MALISRAAPGRGASRRLPTVGNRAGLPTIAHGFALFALEFTDSLAAPALTAAFYSFLSILLTLFMFRETLPATRRVTGRINLSPVVFNVIHMLRRPAVNPLLLLMFSQQLVFFALNAVDLRVGTAAAAADESCARQGRSE